MQPPTLRALAARTARSKWLWLDVDVRKRRRGLHELDAVGTYLAATREGGAAGASLISLPQKTAKSFGLKPSASDETILLQLADGRTIQAKLMKLSEVRVGKFTLKDVECAVLGPEAIAAEPLLGMSFLGHFKFEIDAQAETLTMVKVKTSASRTSRTSRKKKQ